MKKITRNRMIEETVWIAYDGKAFCAEKFCLEYEDEMYPNGIRNRTDIVWYDDAVNMHPLDCDYTNKSHAYVWVKPLTEEAVNELIRAYGYTNNYEADIKQGETICLEENSVGEWNFAGNLNSSLEHAEKFKNAFSKEI